MNAENHDNVQVVAVTNPNGMVIKLYGYNTPEGSWECFHTGNIQNSGPNKPWWERFYSGPIKPWGNITVRRYLRPREDEAFQIHIKTLTVCSVCPACVPPASPS
jgi:hypothetical protein